MDVSSASRVCWLMVLACLGQAPSGRLAVVTGLVNRADVDVGVDQAGLDTDRDRGSLATRTLGGLVDDHLARRLVNLVQHATAPERKALPLFPRVGLVRLVGFRLVAVLVGRVRSTA